MRDSLGRKFYLKIGATPQEADLYALADRIHKETGETEKLFEAQSMYCRGFLFRRNAARWLGRDKRVPNTHYSDYSDGKYITLACTQEEVRPDSVQPDIKEGHEPMVFIGEGKYYTFDKWWVTCPECKRTIREKGKDNG